MSVLIHYNHCPACNAEQIHPALSAIDYTVSKQPFAIWHCDGCSFRFTQDIPDINAIGSYYQSNSYVSHSDTKEGLINQLYHLVRNYTLGTKSRLIQRVTGLSAGTILDIGAGTGAFANAMQAKAWKVTGLEPDASARMQAEKNYGINLIIPNSIDQLENNYFNAITLWHVLEHVHDLAGYWQQFSRLIAPNGKLVIAVPNYTSSDAEHYGAYWAAYDVPRHLYHFSPASMEKLALQHGFRLVKLQPMWFDSFYVSMLSETYQNGKSNLLAACWQGLKSNFKALFDNRECSSVIYVFEKIAA
ncbi:MAG: class I SAM-dependent methyltransferase [Sediminibacterium sp.]|nr:class I SAM-dependent methyltransferase [Sediminibacterium sp.]